MGMEQSRNNIVDIEQLTKNRTVKFYNDEGYSTPTFAYALDNYDTKIKQFVKTANSILPKNSTILEVCSGNGKNTKYIQSLFGKHIIATDINPFSEEASYYPVERLSSDQAVAKYGDSCNVLLIISPPPNNYSDYYAIKPFGNKKGKFVIYFGELGASDGGDGMWNYMMNSGEWKELYRERIHSSIDCFGGPIEKNFHLFQKT